MAEHANGGHDVMIRRMILYCILSLTLCYAGLSSPAFGQDNSSINYTLEDLGFDSTTYSETDAGVKLTFNSPYEESKGSLNIHLIVTDDGPIKVMINSATIFSEDLDESEYRGELNIPTGLIDEGENVLDINFPGTYYEITLLEDSNIIVMAE